MSGKKTIFFQHLTQWDYHKDVKQKLIMNINLKEIRVRNKKEEQTMSPIE